MSAEIWLGMAGILSTAGVSAVALVNSWRREHLQQGRMDALVAAERRLEEKLLRAPEPSPARPSPPSAPAPAAPAPLPAAGVTSPPLAPGGMEFDIEARFFTAEKSAFLTEFVVIVRNQGSLPRTLQN